LTASYVALLNGIMTSGVGNSGGEENGLSERSPK